MNKAQMKRAEGARQIFLATTHPAPVPWFSEYVR